MRQKGGGDMPLYGQWVCLWSYIGTPQRHGFLGYIQLKTPYYCWPSSQSWEKDHLLCSFCFLLCSGEDRLRFEIKYCHSLVMCRSIYIKHGSYLMMDITNSKFGTWIMNCMWTTLSLTFNLYYLLMNICILWKW